MIFTILPMTVQFLWMVTLRLETFPITPITNLSWVPLRQYPWQTFLRLEVVARHLSLSNLRIQLMQVQDLPTKTQNSLKSMQLPSLWILLFRQEQRDRNSNSTSITQISSSHIYHRLILILILFWIPLGTTLSITILPCVNLRNMLPS